MASVVDDVAYWRLRAWHLWGMNIRTLPMPEVVFDLAGRAAGQAVFALQEPHRPDRLRFNAALLASHPDFMRTETVPHELAHLVVYRRYGRSAKPHGKQWRALMELFGVPARACHNLPTEPTRRLRRFAYRCGCVDPVWLTSIRHNRAVRGERYRCRRCGEVLVYCPST